MQTRSRIASPLRQIRHSSARSHSRFRRLAPLRPLRRRLDHADRQRRTIARHEPTRRREPGRTIPFAWRDPSRFTFDPRRTLEGECQARYPWVGCVSQERDSSQLGMTVTPGPTGLEQARCRPRRRDARGPEARLGNEQLETSCYTSGRCGRDAGRARSPRATSRAGVPLRSRV